MLKTISNIKVNTDRFNWIFNRKEEKSPYPPIVWNDKNIFYQLNMFNSNQNEYILIEGDFTNAINSSIDFYNLKTINLIELSNIYKLALKYNKNYNDLSIFSYMGIKGKKHLQILKEIQNEELLLKKYIAEKNISLKQLSIYLKLNQNIKKIVYDFVKKNNPSISSFRKLINLLFDYSRYIDIDYYDEKYFEKIIENKNKIKYEFENEFNEICNKFDRIKITNSDNFETTLINFSFNANTFDNFILNLEELNLKKENINKIFNLLKKYDLY